MSAGRDPEGLSVVGGLQVDVDDLFVLSTECREAARRVAEICAAATAAHAAAQPALLWDLARDPTAGGVTAGSVTAGGVAAGGVMAAALRALDGGAGLGQAAAAGGQLARLGLRIALAADAYDGTETDLAARVARLGVDVDSLSTASGYLAQLLGNPAARGPSRGADPHALAESAAGPLAGAFPPRVASVGPRRSLGPAPAPAGVADLVRLIKGAAPLEGAVEPPPPGRVDVLAVRSGADADSDAEAETVYVVALPGTSTLRWPHDPYANDEPRDWHANLQLLAGQTTAEVAALPEALAAAGVPVGAAVAMVGHSQGGLTAYAAAGDPRMRATYRVTHVVTAGSPTGAMAAPVGVRVLGLENRRDIVPQLDGRASAGSALRTTVRFDGARGGAGHEVAEYAAAAARVDASGDQRLAELRDSLSGGGYTPGPDGRAELTRVELRLHRPDDVQSTSRGGPRPAGEEPAAAPGGA